MSELVADMATPDPPRATNDTESTGAFVKIVENFRNRINMAARAFSASSRQREQWDRQNYNQSRNEYNEEHNSYEEYNSNNRRGRGNPMPIIYVNNINGGNKIRVNQNVNIDNNPPTQFKHKVHINKKQYRRIDLYIRKLAGVKSILTNADKLKIKDFIKNWEKVAKKLGFEDSVIDQHSKNYRGEEIAEIVYKLIIIWEQLSGRRATVGKLAEALWFSYEFDAIEKLAENYGYGSTAE